jgi:hypothetical protein
MTGCVLGMTSGDGWHDFRIPWDTWAKRIVPASPSVMNAKNLFIGLIMATNSVHKLPNKKSLRLAEG